MKAFALALFATVLALFFAAPVPAYSQKAPSQYFRKDSPRPNPGGQPSAPKSPDKPAAAQPPKFKELSVNAQFYFISDTNRQFAWTKLSATSAKNSKSGVTQIINAETPVQR